MNDILEGAGFDTGAIERRRRRKRYEFLRERQREQEAEARARNESEPEDDAAPGRYEPLDGSGIIAREDGIRETDDPEVIPRYQPPGERVQNQATIELQFDLQAVGIDLGPDGVDGYYGEDTRDAVMQWQRRNGYEATGNLTEPQRKRLRGQRNDILFSPSKLHE